MSWLSFARFGRALGAAATMFTVLTTTASEAGAGDPRAMPPHPFVMAALAANPMPTGPAKRANGIVVQEMVASAQKAVRLVPRPVALKRDRLPQRWRYERNRFSALIERYARENGVPAELGHAVIEIESQFRPNVRGRAGEIGLMQIKPATARMLGFRGSARALYDPETNIKYGMRYLGKARRLGAEKGVCGTILKYNAGHGARRMNPISRQYCEKVKAVFARNDRRWKALDVKQYAALDENVPLPLTRALD